MAAKAAALSTIRRGDKAGTQYYAANLLSTNPSDSFRQPSFQIIGKRPSHALFGKQLKQDPWITLLVHALHAGEDQCVLQ